MPSSVLVKAGRCPRTSTSRAAGSNSTSPILIRGAWTDWRPALQRPDPGQQLAEVERLDQVVVRARVQAQRSGRPGCPAR